MYTSSITGSFSVDLLIGYGEPCDYLKIPEAWLEKIVSLNGTCNMIACAVLAQIKFAYRPKKMPDGTYGKYFADDLYRISYDELAKKIHQTKCTVRNACIFLEELGLIKRSFRTVVVGGIRQSNVLYIDLNVEKLKEIEKDSEVYTEPVYISDNTECEDKEDEYLSTKKSIGGTYADDTNNNKRLINNTINFYPSTFSQSKELLKKEDYAITEREIKKNIGYDRLCLVFSDQLYLVDKLVQESAEAVLSRRDYKLSGNRYISSQKARETFLSLGYDECFAVLRAALKQPNVGSIKFYLRTCLFEEVNKRSIKKSSFAGYRDFMQNDYDFDELEASLIAN